MPQMLRLSALGTVTKLTFYGNALKGRGNNSDKYVKFLYLPRKNGPICNNIMCSWVILMLLLPDIERGQSQK